MDVAALKRHCRSLPGSVEQLYADPANILVYAVGGKRFAYFKTSAPERWRFSFKVAPERFLELTDQPGIKPARWLGIHRWITVVDVASVPTTELKALVGWSYGYAWDRLTRRQRAAILDDAPDADGPAP
jgi:predicted DNA-binding protein (MmcQ/YjbR family)